MDNGKLANLEALIRAALERLASLEHGHIPANTLRLGNGQRPQIRIEFVTTGGDGSKPYVGVGTPEVPVPGTATGPILTGGSGFIIAVDPDTPTYPVTATTPLATGQGSVMVSDSNGVWTELVRGSDGARLEVDGSGLAWVTPASLSTIARACNVSATGTVNGTIAGGTITGNQVFRLPRVPTLDPLGNSTLKVYVRRQRLARGTDYTHAGRKIILTVPPVTGDLAPLCDFEYDTSAAVVNWAPYMGPFRSKRKRAASAPARNRRRMMLPHRGI